jgi:hypothetical protein
MFLTRGLIFRKTAVYAVMVRYGCSNTLFYLLDCFYRCMYKVPYHNRIYNRLPEDEPSCSKHVEDIKI